jgi:hypothetical protein
LRWDPLLQLVYECQLIYDGRTSAGLLPPHTYPCRMKPKTT